MSNSITIPYIGYLGVVEDQWYSLMRGRGEELPNGNFWDVSKCGRL